MQNKCRVKNNTKKEQGNREKPYWGEQPSPVSYFVSYRTKILNTDFYFIFLFLNTISQKHPPKTETQHSDFGNDIFNTYTLLACFCVILSYFSVQSHLLFKNRKKKNSLIKTREEFHWAA